ncbi:hypothetical protein [Devosia riboflavina]
MTLDSRIMEMVRRAKANYGGDLDISDFGESDDDHVDDIKTHILCAASFEGQHAMLSGVGDTIDTHSINGSAHEKRRAEYVYLMNTALDELKCRGLYADMMVAPADAPGVADLLRRLAWALDSYVDFDEAVLGLQDQDLEHRHWIEWRPPTLAAIAISQPLDQPGPEILKIHRLLQNLERIAMLAQSVKVIVQAEKRMPVHDDAP